MDREAELELVRRVQDGDEDAFDAVYGAFNARLFGFLARLTGRREVAEELVEETWLRFVRHADRLEPDTRLGAWLFTVARNLHVSYCRTHVTESEGLIGLSLWPVESAESPFDLACRSELERRVTEALAALPAVLREALVLVGVEGLQPSEAAAICGITPEAMRQRVRRARLVLAESLGDTVRDRRLRAGA
jgi:RNA polymerase sigma-70 factor (ECF subfamily)